MKYLSIIFIVLVGCASTPTQLVVSPVPRNEAFADRCLSIQVAESSHEKVRIIVRDDHGISSASINKKQGGWPKTIIVEFPEFDLLEGFAAYVDGNNKAAKISLDSTRGKMNGGGYRVTISTKAIGDNVSMINISWINAFRS